MFCASARKRGRNVDSDRYSSLRIFAATSRPSTESTPFQTSPMPPTAIREVSLYRLPNRVPSTGLISRPPLPSCSWRSARRPSHHKRSEEHTSELQSRGHLVCRLLLEKTKPTDSQ